MPLETVSAGRRMNACYESIHDFFDAFSLPQARAYLLSAIKTAEKDMVWKKSAPADLLYFFEQFEALLNDALQIAESGYKKNSTLLPADRIPDPARWQCYCIPAGKQQAWFYVPKCLTQKEYNDPYRALKKCAEWSGKNEWKETMKNILNYALSANSFSENGVAMETVQIAQLLQKLLEACHLIHVRIRNEAAAEVSR